MEQFERFGEHIQQHLLRLHAGRLVLARQTGLGELDVPVAEAVPDEVIDLLRGDAELVLIEIFADLAGQLVEP